jgi:xanthine/CO dehydrogenase XdhC/CoxF family maturation factor
MLITETGETFGTISGGCLEADVRERAFGVLRNGRPVLVTYINGGRSEPGASLNMGCDGTIRILIETLGSGNCFDVIDECIQRHQTVADATLIASNDVNALGSRIVFDGSAIFADPGFRDKRNEIVRELKAALNEGRSKCVVTNDARAEYFVEVIRPPNQLIVFGAGQDALPVVRFSTELGWRVTLVDHREAFRP